MARAVWRLSEPQLREWLDRLLGDGYSVVAPIREDEVLLYGRIKAAGAATLSPAGKTRWSPKEYVFPRSETLYNYAFDSGTVKLVDPPRQQKQVLFGVRPCDAAGLVRLDKAFLDGIPDAIYANRRENTFVVSTACAEADPECFCTAVAGSPIGEEGSDAQLLSVEGNWLLRVLTDKGAELVEGASKDWAKATKQDQAKIKETGARVTAQIAKQPLDHAWSELLQRGFDHPAWARAAERCLACSTCAYVCPSCSCFDMNHEGSSWGGRQVRSWDACTFELFTRHASGHNPRPTRAARYRQRVLHKFSFSTPDAESFRCVGCGRCVALCPAGVDIVEAVRTVVAAVQEEPQNAGR